jgi:hypothetical protein
MIVFIIVLEEGKDPHHTSALHPYLLEVHKASAYRGWHDRPSFFLFARFISEPTDRITMKFGIGVCIKIFITN